MATTKGRIYTRNYDLKRAAKLTKNIAKKIGDNKPFLRKAAAYMLKTVDRHFDEQRNKDGSPWPSFSPMTHFMHQRNPSINVGKLLVKTGTFRKSFRSIITDKTAFVESRTTTKDGKFNLGRLHHFGARISVTEETQVFMRNAFGIKMNTGVMVIPSRQVLFLNKDERKELNEMFAKHVNEILKEG